MTSPALLTMHSLAAEIAAPRLSPVDVPEAYLTRIDRLDGKLHAFVSVNATRARLTPEAAAGKAIRSGHAVGPLPRHSDRDQGSRGRSRARLLWAGQLPGLAESPTRPR
jgi:hypothetical protein